MRFDNSSLFVNTGRKPLSAMQKRKRKTRNSIVVAVFVSIIALIMFVLFVCADSYNAVKELLLNNIFLTALNFISALLIPIIYLFVYRRKLYE